MSEKFILVSLEEDKAKKLADVIGNSTSRKILDYLGGVKEASESEVAEKLKIPISTVHYNIQQLVKAGLVESKEFRWSDKGREINIYRIAKRYVVIAPKGVTGLREKLKGVLPLFVLSAGAAAVVQWVANSRLASIQSFDDFGREAVVKSAENIVESAAISGAVDEVATCAPTLVTQAVPNYGLWFFIGAVFVIVLYLLIKRKK